MQIPLPIQVEQQSIRARLLEFINGGFFLTAVGTVGGIVGALVYMPALLISAACIFLGFHKARVVEGQPLRMQCVGWAVIILITCSSLYGISTFIRTHLPKPLTAQQIVDEWARRFGNKAEKSETRTVAAPVVPQAPEPHPYSLMGGRRTEFLKLLKAPISGDVLRVGCVPWSERSCVAAGQFMILLSEAGWRIEGNRVVQEQTNSPDEGISVVSRPDQPTGTPLPPHRGRWHEMNLTEMTLEAAFSEMGINVRGASDASIESGTTGVYFGPEPTTYYVEKDRTLLFLKKFINEGEAIHERFVTSNDASAEAREEREWTSNSYEWIKKNLGDSVAKDFRKASGVTGKYKYLISIQPRYARARPQ
jgi:hypothetical protein